MKKIIYSLITILFISQLTTAQNNLRFEFDYAKFNYDSASVFLEFYYELNTFRMQVIKTEQGWYNEAVVHIELKNTETNNFVINRDWKVQNPVSPGEKDSSFKVLTGLLSFIVPGGKYSLQVKAYDTKSPDYNTVINENVTLQPYTSNKFSISDIEISTNIKTDNADQNSIFYKNTLEILPNPSMVYTNQSPVMFYYSELYNLKLENQSVDFTLQKSLLNSAGTQVYQNSKKIKQGGNSVVEYGVVNLSKLPTDSYNFVLKLVDPISNQAYVTSKRFYLFNPSVKDTLKNKRIDTGVLGSEFAVFLNEDCDRMFSEVKYIASNDETAQYKKLDSLNAKRQFLYKFWLSRDPDPSTPKNEFKEEYDKRIAFANKNFSSSMKQGYLTDRGRVVLLYGEPDQRDFFPSDTGYKPYEVWFYTEIEGGVNFYFGDVTGFGNYELLHSTKRGEVNDANWMRRISTL